MTAKARTPKTPPPPAGLVAMMSLFRSDSETGHAAESNARLAYPLAQRVIEELRGGTVKREWDSLDNVAVEMFPSLGDEAPTETTCTLAGFYIGIAAAWLLLQDVNGGTR